MEKHFCNYNQSLALKELGFDMPCLASWNFYTNEFNYNSYPSTFSSDDVIQLPLKSQVFEWFKNKHGIWVTFEYDDCDCVEANVCWYVGNCFRYGIGPLYLTNELGDFKTYEEAESACIDKLIELIKQKL